MLRLHHIRCLCKKNHSNRKEWVCNVQRLRGPSLGAICIGSLKAREKGMAMNMIPLRVHQRRASVEGSNSNTHEPLLWKTICKGWGCRRTTAAKGRVGYACESPMRDPYTKRGQYFPHIPHPYMYSIHTYQMYVFYTYFSIPRISRCKPDPSHGGCRTVKSKPT